MKSFILCIFVSVMLICKVPAQAVTFTSNSSNELSGNKKLQPLTILFIGNSHTYTNDIPAIISRMAHSAGDSIYTRMSTPGGYNFKSHSVLGATISAIQSKKWDYIVLQESGYWGAAPSNIADSMVYPYAQLLNDLIKKNSDSTIVILYMTHGYKYGSSWCSTYSNLCTYAGMQEVVKQNYIKMSKLLNAQVAPAGILWKIIMQQDSSLELFAGDNYHPNIKGSYISACTIYATIFHKKITGAYYPPEIPKETAFLIQNKVSEVLINDNPDWHNQ